MRIASPGDPKAPKNDLKNPDPALRTRLLCGLVIGTAFAKDGDQKADNGKIYDPLSGKTYSGSMRTDGPDTLKLRGYVGVSLLGRTETWHRATGSVGSCKAN